MRKMMPSRELAMEVFVSSVTWRMKNQSKIAIPMYPIFWCVQGKSSALVAFSSALEIYKWIISLPTIIQVRNYDII